MIKAIVFDYNGVISNADWYWTIIADRVPNLSEREREFDALAKEVDLGHITAEELRTRLAELLGITLDDIAAWRANIYDSPNYLRRDLVELIKQLRTKYKIGLLSNYSALSLRPLLEKHGALELFDEIAISSEIGFVKPDPRAFLYVAEKFDLAPEEILFIDDRAKLVVAAEELGFLGHAFTTTLEFKQFLSKQGLM